MKKKIILTVFLCLVFIFSFFAGCNEYSSHSVKNSEIKQTQYFLDQPDIILCILNKKEKTLNEYAANEIYTEFIKLMSKMCYTDTLKNLFSEKYIDKWKNECIAFEFRYDQRREFTGSLPPLGEKDFFTWGNLKFDAFLFVYYSETLIAIPYLEGKYMGINDLFLRLNFPVEDLKNFIEVVQNVVL